MTGTSCDGLDFVTMAFTDRDSKTLSYVSKPYPPALRQRVLSFQKPGSRHSAQEWLNLDRDLGIWYAKTFKVLLKNQNIDAISNHGQTLAHFPDEKPLGTTLQLGDSFIVAEHTGITTIGNHRKGDLAGGGQGAPLAPIFHEKIIRDHFKKNASVSIHNLGGISNFSYFKNGVCLFAFDTGPGNCMIDAAVEAHSKGKLRFDTDGKLASMGQIDLAAVSKILRHPFIKKPLPKSTGRDEFHLELLRSLTHSKGKDLIATATEMTVQTITLAYEKFIFERKLPLNAIVFTGGGAKNKFLIHQLKKRLRRTRVLTSEELGINSQAIEAQAFAYMGYLTLKGLALGGIWTGAHSHSPPACIVPGRNWNSLLGKLR